MGYDLIHSRLPTLVAFPIPDIEFAHIVAMYSL